MRWPDLDRRELWVDPSGALLLGAQSLEALDPARRSHDWTRCALWDFAALPAGARRAFLAAYVQAQNTGRVERAQLLTELRSELEA